MDGRRRLVDLDVRRAGLDQSLQLGREDGHERPGRRDAIGIDVTRAVRQPSGQRERTGQRDLDGSRGATARVLELLDDPQPMGRGDGLQDLESVLLVVAAGTQAAIGWQRLDTGQVTIELGREEPSAAHLAVRDDIDAGILLVSQCRVHGIVLDLADVHRAELASTLRRDRQVQPAGSSVGSDHRGGQWRGLVRAARCAVDHGSSLPDSCPR